MFDFFPKALDITVLGIPALKVALTHIFKLIFSQNHIEPKFVDSYKLVEILRADPLKEIVSYHKFLLFEKLVKKVWMVFHF